MKALNNYIEVKPIPINDFIVQQDPLFTEKGIVVTADKFNPGDIVHFDSWMVKKIETSDKEIRWLVPQENICYVESVSK